MHIVEDAVGHVTEDHLAALETENAALRRVFQTGDIGRAAQVDSAFHRIMQQASGNVTVVGLLQGLDKKISRFLHHIKLEALCVQDVLSEHAGIAQALRAQDGIVTLTCPHSR